MKTVTPTLSFITLLAFSSNALQSYTITTIAPPSSPPPEAQVTDLPISTPTSVATDSTGNFYFASSWHNKVFRVDPDGKLTVAAGSGVQGFNGDAGRQFRRSCSAREAWRSIGAAISSSQTRETDGSAEFHLRA